MSHNRIRRNPLNPGIRHIVRVYIADKRISRIFGQFGLKLSIRLCPDCRIIRLARQSDDPAVRAEAYAKFQAELAKDPAYAFICYIDADYVADSRIQGIAPDTVMGHHGVGIFWNITEWTIVK